MITLEDDDLVFRFREVHEDAECSIQFQRTLRIPDDGTDYPLPVPPIYLIRGALRTPTGLSVVR